MFSIESRGLKLQVDPEAATYSLFNSEYPQLYFKNVSFAFQLISPFPIYASLLKLVNAEPIVLDRGRGRQLQGFRIEYFDRLNKVAFIVRLGLCDDQAMLLVECSLTNQGSAAIWPQKLYAGIMPAGGLNLTKGSPEPCFHTNGWQSWSPSMTYRLGERQARSWLGPLSDPMNTNHGTPRTRLINHFSSDMFACLGDLESGNGLLLGYLTQKETFGSIETHLDLQSDLAIWANTDGLRLDPGKTITADWASFSFNRLDAPQPFRNYLQEVAKVNKVRNKQAAPLGWCSWYYYFQNMSEEIVHQNLDEVSRIRGSLPLELVQIDDGYEKSVGEWLQFNDRFPHGVRPLADEIKARNFIPGIWIAPYIVQSSSGLIQKHPEWLLKGRVTGRANAGYVWNAIGRALDLTVPEAFDYTQSVIRTAVHDWGFKYLKLDFLYAAALAGRYSDPTFTRAQVLRKGLEGIRAAAGEDVQLLGCGCPLGSAVGIMDFMRISEDVSPDWEPVYYGMRKIFQHEYCMPSARNAIHNILTRTELDGHWWGNDPDCLLVRKESNLNLDEVQTLATAIGMTGGALLVSDNLPELNEERRSIIASLMPVIPSQPHVLDLFENLHPSRLKQNLHTHAGSWPLVSVINWADCPQDITIRASEWGLPEGKTWIAREFWTGELHIWEDDLLLRQVPAHASRVLTLHEMTGKALYLGSELHFSQGFELKDWRESQHALSFRISIGRLARGRIYLYLPQAPVSLLQNNDAVPIEKMPIDHIYSFVAEIDGEAKFRIQF